MDEPFKVLTEERPSASKISSMLSLFSSLPKHGTKQCSQFVKEASTAKVFRACEHGKSECSDECFAVKVIRKGKYDEKEPKLQEYLTSRIKGTEAEAHFNKLYRILPAPEGESKTIVLEFEHPWAQNVSDLSTLLQNFDMTEKLWKAINFQVISAFATAQRRVPGFTHNDSHTSNILVTRNVGDEHVCSITSPKGRRMTTFSNMVIKIIDFGQALTFDPKYQTRDGLAFWKDLMGNKMIDFHRFAVWSSFDIQMGALKQKSQGLRQQYPAWFTEWRRFVSRWLVLQMMPDVDSSGRDREKGLWLSENALVPNTIGAAYLQQHYSATSKLGLADMLDDPYFDEYVIGGKKGPSLIEFEKEVKVKKCKN